MKSKGHRLRCLKMREARHQRVGMFVSTAQQHGLHLGKRGVDRVNQLAHPQPEVRRHLVVARTGGVKPARRLANQFGKPRFDVHVDVFELGGEDEAAGGDLAKDRRKAAMDRVAVLRRDDATMRQHAGMRLRAGYVLPEKTAVIVDRGVDVLHQLRRPA